MESPCLWQPDSKRTERSNFSRWEAWLQRERGLSFPDYPSQWKWSVEKPGAFWEALAAYFQVRFHTPPSHALGEQRMPDVEWFPGATLNYAEHVFLSEESSPAIVAAAEGGTTISLTRSELAQRVAVVAQSLRSLGIGVGDRVVGYLPNTLESVVAFLATASVGAIWSNCPVELKAAGVLERFVQIRPRVIFASTSYRYNGKLFDLTEVVSNILGGLDALEHVFLVGETKMATTSCPCSLWKELPWHEKTPLTFTAVPFSHPLWILFSSGTSGVPKAIVQSHGGILLEHLKALTLHMDLQKGDRFFWYTTAGWMMWNFLVSGLLLPGVTIYLFDGSPKYPDLGALWKFVAEHKITVFGTSAPFLLACMKAGVEPQKLGDLSALHTLGSTGAPLPGEGFDWVYREVKSDILLAPISGGTDFCTAVVISHPHLPVHRGEMQCLALGANVQSWDENGKHDHQRVGELVIPTHLPSMPVYFWNDPNGKRLKASYFERFPGAWHHGDWIEIRSTAERVVISGRSDSTLNRGGVRMGTSEFYSVVEAHPAVDHALVVDTSQMGNEGRLLLFLKLAEGSALTEELKKEIDDLLRARLSPRHVPDLIVAVPGIPHSINGKKLEIPIKRLLAGVPAEKALARETLADPACLSWYQGFAAQHSD